MNAFEQAVADVLEVAAVRPTDAFRDLPGWNSLKGFGLLVLLENDWDAPVSIDRFLTLTTVRDLYREAFVAFAARLFKVPRESLTGTSAYGSCPEWDSVNHLRLVMEAEKRFGVRYALETIPEIKTIDNFIDKAEPTNS